MSGIGSNLQSIQRLDQIQARAAVAAPASGKALPLAKPAEKLQADLDAWQGQIKVPPAMQGALDEVNQAVDALQRALTEEMKKPVAARDTKQLKALYGQLTEATAKLKSQLEDGTLTLVKSQLAAATPEQVKAYKQAAINNQPVTIGADTVPPELVLKALDASAPSGKVALPASIDRQAAIQKGANLATSADQIEGKKGASAAVAYQAFAKKHTNANLQYLTIGASFKEKLLNDKASDGDKAQFALQVAIVEHGDKLGNASSAEAKASDAAVDAFAAKHRLPAVKDLKLFLRNPHTDPARKLESLIDGGCSLAQAKELMTTLNDMNQQAIQAGAKANYLELGGTISPKVPFSVQTLAAGNYEASDGLPGTFPLARTGTAEPDYVGLFNNDYSQFQAGGPRGNTNAVTTVGTVYAKTAEMKAGDGLETSLTMEAMGLNFASNNDASIRPKLTLAVQTNDGKPVELTISFSRNAPPTISAKPPMKGDELPFGMRFANGVLDLGPHVTKGQAFKVTASCQATQFANGGPTADDFAISLVQDKTKAFGVSDFKNYKPGTAEIPAGVSILDQTQRTNVLDSLRVGKQLAFASLVGDGIHAKAPKNVESPTHRRSDATISYANDGFTIDIRSTTESRPVNNPRKAYDGTPDMNVALSQDRTCAMGVRMVDDLLAQLQKEHGGKAPDPASADGKIYAQLQAIRADLAGKMIDQGALPPAP